MRFLLILLEKITPDLREILVDAISKLETMAKKTPNVYDDIFVFFLKKILAID